jgi:hypothetical protein
LTGKADYLPDVDLGLTPPVTAQLRNRAGECWGATYSTFTKNDAGEYRAKSD